MPAALRRPQKKHVLDVQSMSRSENITFFTLSDVFTRFYSFVLGDSVPAALRRPQKKHVLDFQSMSQSQNITNKHVFSFLDDFQACGPEQRACGASQTSDKNRSWIFRACHSPKTSPILSFWIMCAVVVCGGNIPDP